MKLEFSLQIFEKYSRVKFHENPFSWNRILPCGGRHCFLTSLLLYVLTMGGGKLAALAQWDLPANALHTVIVNKQFEAQFFFLYLFIPFLCMFRATKCSSSGESIVSIRLLVYVTVCRWPCGMQVPSQLAYHTVTYTEWHIPEVVLIQLTLLMMSTWLLETCREMEETNIELCVKLVIFKDCNKMHGQQNIKKHYIQCDILIYTSSFRVPPNSLVSDSTVT